MIESWINRYSFLQDVNPVTKIISAIIIFFVLLFIHNFDMMVYLTLLMFVYLIIFSGIKLKPLFIVLTIVTVLSMTSSLFMLFYGDGERTLFKFYFIHITWESLTRSSHLFMRSFVVTLYGMAIAFTTRIVMIFYSLMINLKLKPKYAYGFMAAIRMVPIFIDEAIRLRKALKMRYQVIDKKFYNGLNRVNHYLIPLLSQSIRKAHRLAVAMETKGFTNGKRTYYYHPKFSKFDVLYIILTIVIFIIAMVLGHHFPIFNINDVR